MSTNVTEWCFKLELKKVNARIIRKVRSLWIWYRSDVVIIGGDVNKRPHSSNSMAVPLNLRHPA